MPKNLQNLKIFNFLSSLSVKENGLYNETLILRSRYFCVYFEASTDEDVKSRETQYGIVCDELNEADVIKNYIVNEYMKDHILEPRRKI